MLLKTLDPDRNNKPIFSEQRTNLVSPRGSLLNHKLTGIAQRFDILLLRGFDRNKVDARAACCFTNRQRIVLLTFGKCFHVLGRDKPYAESHSAEGSAPV